MMCHSRICIVFTVFLAMANSSTYCCLGFFSIMPITRTAIGQYTIMSSSVVISLLGIAVNFTGDFSFSAPN